MNFEVTLNGVTREVLVETYPFGGPGLRTVIVSLDDSYERMVELRVTEDNLRYIAYHTVSNDEELSEMLDVVEEVFQQLDVSDIAEEQYDSGYESEEDSDSEYESLEIPEDW